MKKGEFLAVFQILILFVAIVAVADLVSAADDDEDSEEGEDESRGWFGKVWGFASLPAKKLVGWVGGGDKAAATAKAGAEATEGLGTTNFGLMGTPEKALGGIVQG
ncbi:hypothetical protein KAR91_38840, partial [Candidatus Pacearchaeota archaeon]|nr:hypothetical protein [Candidatus Pacearchaeota archaeon]